MYTPPSWRRLTLVLAATLALGGVSPTLAHATTPATTAAVQAPVMTPLSYTGQVQYRPGFGINVLKVPGVNSSWTGQRLPHGSRWHVSGAQTVAGQRYLRLGKNQWVDARYVVDAAKLPQQHAAEPAKGTATVTYAAGYSIAVFNAPAGHPTGQKLKTSSRWRVHGQQTVKGVTWYQLGKNQWVNGRNVVVTGSQYRGQVRLNVPLIRQRPELPNGCEITAVTMMVNYAGNPVSKMTLAREMPRHPSNPNLGYLGNPAGYGITIFPPALMKLVTRYTGNAKNLTGLGLDALYYQLDAGHPVVTWNTLHGFPYHALTVSGYDAQRIYYNDCWTGQKTSMTKAQFLSNWRTQQGRAISY